LAKAAAVDWITCTTESEKVGLSWFEVLTYAAGPRSTWSNKWYRGTKIPHARWGFSEERGFILILSGPLAEKHVHSVATSAKSITRLDLCVDVELEEPIPDLAERYYEHNNECGKRRYALIVNNRHGKTLYVGSRQSDQFGRVYDKGVESKTLRPGLLWRYEVELKKPRSKPVYDELHKKYKNNRDDHARSIFTYVANWFDAREVAPPWNGDVESDIVVSIGKTVTTADRKIAWLRTQVRPTIAFLVRAGLQERLEEAIGFTLAGACDDLGEMALDNPLDS
jgi:DNA relaxase NicK